MTRRDDTALLQARGVTKRYGRRSDAPLAVDSVDLTLHRGEVLGIVGESGSGKSTLGRMLMRLTPVTSGEIYLRGTRVDTLSERAFAPMRPRIQVVFQQPTSSFDPRWTVRRSVVEHLRMRAERDLDVQAETDRLARAVSMDPALLDRRPSQVSGGQLQRFSIARALASKPDVVVLDEPTSALDVSIRSQIVHLLMRLRADEGLSFVLISHDMEVIRAMSTTVAVMRAGCWVEHGPVTEVLGSPQHEYTRRLLAAADAGMEHLRAGARRAGGAT